MVGAGKAAKAVNLTIAMDEVYHEAEFRLDSKGVYVLPSDGEAQIDASTAKVLEVILQRLGGPWRPGAPQVSVTITGRMPMWLALRLPCWLRPKVKEAFYVSPAVPVPVNIFEF